MAVIDRVLVGEALVVENRPDGSGLDLLNVAHIDLIIGPRGSAAEMAFCNTLTNQKQGVNGLLAIVAPNMMCKPATVMFNKFTIKNGKQAVQMFGPAQRGVAMAVMDCVADGTIPADEADDVFISVGVFIDHNADIDSRIQDWNYQATKQAIKSAIAREPKAADVVKSYKASAHPFAAHN
jgi:5,6,7,8-tetrahydromethanopterin hydro-lyase